MLVELGSAFLLILLFLLLLRLLLVLLLLLLLLLSLLWLRLSLLLSCVLLVLLVVSRVSYGCHAPYPCWIPLVNPAWLIKTTPCCAMLDNQIIAMMTMKPTTTNNNNNNDDGGDDGWCLESITQGIPSGPKRILRVNKNSEFRFDATCQVNIDLNILNFTLKSRNMHWDVEKTVKWTNGETGMWKVCKLPGTPSKENRSVISMKAMNNTQNKWNKHSINN